MKKITRDGKDVLELENAKDQDGRTILVLVATQHNKYRFNDRATVPLDYMDVAGLSLTLQLWLEANK